MARIAAPHAGQGIRAARSQRKARRAQDPVSHAERGATPKRGRGKPQDPAGGAPGGPSTSTLRLKELITDLGRFRSLRDPIASLAHDVTPPQLHTLMWLGLDGPLPLHVIAQRIGCTQPTVTGIVDRLEKVGLVERERDTGDRRVVRVRLTALGRASHGELDRAFTAQLDSLLSHLNPRDTEHLLRILKTLVQSVRSQHAATSRPAPPPVPTIPSEEP